MRDRKLKNEKNLQELFDIIKKSNIKIIGVLEGEWREKGTKTPICFKAFQRKFQ